MLVGETRIEYYDTRRPAVAPVMAALSVPRRVFAGAARAPPPSSATRGTRTACSAAAAVPSPSAHGGKKTV